MRNLPLAALRAFAVAYEVGGVRRAASSLGVAHSAVSRHLRELEAWLGVALIEPRRGAARLAFTPNGEALGKAALSGLSELAHAVEATREGRRANGVVIATTASIAARWLIPRLTTLRQSHPWIEVSVITQQATLDPARQGADMALRMGSEPSVEGKSELLMDDALYPVASPEYWRGLRVANAKRAIASARLLHDRDPSSAWERWFRPFPATGVNLRAGPRFTSSDLVLRAAAVGLGLALARDRLAASDIAAGVLIRPFGACEVKLARAYWLVLPSAGLASAAQETVAQWLREQT